MRFLPLLPVLLLMACGGNDEGTVRPYSLSRDSAPETMASTQMPLSAPPGLTLRPTRPVMIGSNRSDDQAAGQAAGSMGQDALLQAAGPAAEPDIRAVINENSGLVFPGPGFVDRLMSWTPPADYKPYIVPGSSGGWFSKIF